MNIGLREAKGKYIVILETDDYIEKNMYEVLLGLSEEHSLDFCKRSATLV